MSKFKIGDKVRVREDLEVGKPYGLVHFDEDMVEYLGKEFEVIYVDSEGDYNLRDTHCFWFSDGMLEPVKEGYTFKEVIAKIKEGEEYVCVNGDKYRVNKIYQHGEICIEGELSVDGILFPDVVGISGNQRFKLKERKKKYFMYEVEHKKDGKRYDFRSDDTRPLLGNFVICNTKYGKVYGKVIDTKYVEMTKDKYMEYKECWRA